MSCRKVIFWIHLLAGLVAGGVVAIMSVTGIAIAFEEEILEWADREVSHRVGPVPVNAVMKIEDLRGKVAPENGRVAAVQMFSDPSRNWKFHTDTGRELFVDPYSAAVGESRAHATHEVIHKLEEWHRWLGARDGQTSVGRLVTGICNLMFVVLCVTGLYLWFPRRWSWRALRPLIGFVTRYRGKARDFNLHNVIGFWSMPVLLLLAVTAVPISFAWGHRLVFALTGEEAPESRNYGMMAVEPPAVSIPAGEMPRLPAEVAVSRVAEAFPDWESISLEFPEAEEAIAPLDFGVTVPDPMPSRAYIPVKSDPFTGEILQAVRFDDRSTGLRARVWVRFLHTGAAFGVPGKVVASLACAASLVLVWTGFSLTWRRFSGRRRATKPPTQVTPS